MATDTTYPAGSCTAASAKVAAAMRGAGFPASDLQPYAAPGHPDEGGLVAILRGHRAGATALLLVAHIDTVSADPTGWRTPPFILSEAGGYLRGRGVADNKAVVAVLAETFARLRREGFRPQRDIRFALTCGEETATAFNGARYLATERRDLAAADLVLVPSGGATTGARGNVSIALSAGEKTQQNFRLTATGTATHASRPAADNAIYALARGLARLPDLRFPIAFNPVTRRYFERIASEAEPKRAAAIRALLADPGNREAEAAVTADPTWNAMLRTTCTATVVETGTQLNTVGATAGANVNCRLLPGATVAQVEGELVRVLAGTGLSIRHLPPPAETIPASPIPREILGMLTTAAEVVWPGADVAPTMLTGATDARHFNAAGTPAYGLTVMRYDADGNGVHAADERIAPSAVEEGRAFLYGLIKRFGSAPGR